MAFPVEDKYIEKAETDLGVRFPDSFRSKMSNMNGGEVAVSTDHFELHPFFDTSDKKRLKRTCNSIVHETNTAREHYGLPKSLVIIGNNGGGDVLVFKFDSSGRSDGKVYWLDHEDNDLNFAANDFGDLHEDV
jgi:hypothetical protein